MAFIFKKLSIPELIHIEPEIHSDNRGFLVEAYKYPDFKQEGIDKPFVQVLYSKSTKGTIRGLHYQLKPMAQGKIVSVVEGEIYDVGVDLRKGSPTYGQWAGLKLNDQKKNMLYIPEGFAHGFCVLSKTAQIIYHCTQVYAPEYERGIKWDDPTLNIQWPVQQPVVSEKDNQFPYFEVIKNEKQI